jgi:triacylglycerol esterase/lipase EstA (alpha/beta hydrolase family)
MPDARARVAHIVTIGTPHHGTWLARWGHTTNAIQMQEGSAWLQALAQSEAPDVGTYFTCWHSEGDNIVFPKGVAVLSGCQERHLPWVGHVAMVDHPTVMHDTLALLSQ